jgi:hypothetical protein
MARHQRGEDLSWAKTPNSLRRAAANYFGSYRKAVEAVGVDYGSVRRHRRWNKKLLVAELQKLHARGVRASANVLGREAPGLCRAIHRHIGSMEAARKAAGIDLPGRWSKEKVLEELRERARKKQELAQSRVRAPLVNAAIHYLGSYAKAIAAVGLDYEAIKIHGAGLDREEIIAKLQELDRAGVKLNYGRIREQGWVLLGGMRREFGTTARALKAAGVPYYPRHIWNRRKVLAGLRQVQREGRGLSLSSMLKGNRRLEAAAVKYFGSYGAAIEALGLDYAQVRTTQWSKEKIVGELRRLVESGVKPNGTDIRRANSRLYSASALYFGSLGKALRVAGIKYQKGVGWSRVKVVRRLKDLARVGEDLSPPAMGKRFGTLVNRACEFFGSYDKAIQAAGLDYPDSEQTRNVR